jgi:2-C-methyl-D-erythritol 4-phosphate cytidylyltransferase/2-C-methyl-D-erythritol 2,4-cyclodiphosphate synthase
MNVSVWGIVAAAGSGQRFGADKLSIPLADGKTVLRAACDALLAGGVEGLVIVGAAGPHHELEALGPRVHAIVPGGATRSDSVAAGLAALPEDAELVAVHDAARPFVSPDLVRRLIDAAKEFGAAVPVLPCVDTITESDSNRLINSFERAKLRRVQTPQVMRRELLKALLQEDSASDESSVLIALGHHVAAVPGDERNIKVTTRNDLPQPARRFVSGSGFDVHRFDPERPLMLGGVFIENEPGLAGHSDADVLLHALVDALLGAVGAGDIGEHFPPSEARWRNADSSLFVTAAMQELQRVGARLEHVDLTLIGERPRLTPHKSRIRQRLSLLLNLPLTRINLKATTTEGLGFTGRGEGLAAQAIASLSLPADEER